MGAELGEFEFWREKSSFSDGAKIQNCANRYARKDL
jgi:hypothetical protein